MHLSKGPLLILATTLLAACPGAFEEQAESTRSQASTLLTPVPDDEPLQNLILEMCDDKRLQKLEADAGLSLSHLDHYSEPLKKPMQVLHRKIRLSQINFEDVLNNVMRIRFGDHENWNAYEARVRDDVAGHLVYLQKKIEAGEMTEGEMLKLNDALSAGGNTTGILASRYGREYFGKMNLRFTTNDCKPKTAIAEEAAEVD